MAYGSTFVVDTDDLAKKWWGGVKKQFEKQHPDVTIQLVPIAGGYDDIINKLSLLYRSPKTAPDIAQVPTPVIGEWVASDYLLPVLVGNGIRSGSGGDSGDAHARWSMVSCCCGLR